MKKERLYYIDWLRISVILCLIPYHSALTYTGLGNTYIITPVKGIGVLPFLIVTAPLGSFFMTLLFFISGMSTYYSFQCRSKNKYLKERFKKILMPFALGTIFLCPIQAYFKGLYNGFSGNLIQFIPEFFSSKIVGYLGYAHLWFLLYLFVFSLACVPLFSKWIEDRTKLDKLSAFLCKRNNIYIPILFIAAAEFLLRPFSSGAQTLIMDWANDVAYLSIFIYGFVYAYDVNIQKRVNGLSNTFKPIFCIMVILYIILHYLWVILGTNTMTLEIIWVATKGLYECSAIIFLLWLGKKYFNKNSSILNYLNKASFTYYLIHFIPVSLLTYYFTKININIYIKYLLVISLSYLFVFVFYEVFVKWLHKML